MASYKRWYHDPVTGLPTIRWAEAARDIPTPDEVRAWMRTGSHDGATLEGALERLHDLREGLRGQDYDRCPGCGRANGCKCLDCPYCDENGVPTGTGGHR